MNPTNKIHQAVTNYQSQPISSNVASSNRHAFTGYADENQTYSCEICGHTGQLGVDIEERPYYDRFFKRDNIRYECKNIEKCLDRVEW